MLCYLVLLLHVALEILHLELVLLCQFLLFCITGFPII